MSDNLQKMFIEDSPQDGDNLKGVDNLSNLDAPDLKEVIERKKEKLTGLLLTESPILKERAELMAEPGFWKHALSLPDTRLREIYLEFVLKVVANPTGVTEVELRI